MRKEYVKPSIELELYQLDTSIAGNCDVVTNVGPNDCMDWGDDLIPWSLRGRSTPQHFYEGNCDCEYTGGNSGSFTS